MEESMTIDEILDSHPKGVDYAHLLEGMEKVPVIFDSNDSVLSFPRLSMETIPLSQRIPVIYSSM